MVQVVKNLPPVQETQERHGFDPWLGKVSLEEEMTTHCSVLAWEVPWTEEPGGLQSIVSQRVRHD